VIDRTAAAGSWNSGKRCATVTARNQLARAEQQLDPGQPTNLHYQEADTVSATYVVAYRTARASFREVRQWPA